MTYFDMVSASFFGNILTLMALVAFCLPIVIIEYYKDKNDDESDKNK